MDTKPTTKIEQHFGTVRDRRIGKAKRHKLLNILLIAICALICKADGWSDIEFFGRNKRVIRSKSRPAISSFPAAARPSQDHSKDQT